MQRTGNSKRGKEDNNSPEENKVENRRNFALIGGLIGVVVLVVYLITAAYPSRLFSEVKSTESADQQPIPEVVHAPLPASPLKTSCEAMFANTNQVMAKLFSKIGKKYTAPSLQLFEDTISAYQCGAVLPASGPFYCPADKEIYLDLSFIRSIQKRDATSPELVQAYLIAHQAGHHIEELLGITAKVEAARGLISNDQYKKLLEKQEMLADFYAGVWMHHAYKKSFDSSEAEMTLTYVTQVSIALAKNDEAEVRDPYTFANIGQRSDWFYKGYHSGDLKQGPVFTAEELK